MKTSPIMLDLTARRCVVVGAGPVGLRKAEALRKARAAVCVVDPAPPAGADGDGIERVQAPYDPALLAGAAIVFACTDDPALNARIAADARSAGALVNAADDPAHCDFLLPAVADDGDVVLAVGTGGASPALAKRLRDELARHLPERTGPFAAALGQVRRQVRRKTPDPRRRRRILKRLAGRAGYQAFLADGDEGLIRLADEIAEAT